MAYKKLGIAFFIIAFVLGIPFVGRAKVPSGGDKTPFKPHWVSSFKKGKLFKYQRKEFSSPAVLEDQIFCGSDSGIFYAIRKDNGHKNWHFQASAPINSQPSVWGKGEGSRVIFGDDKGVVHTLDARTGKEIWKKELASEFIVAPTVSGDRVYLVTVSGQVLSLNIQEGGVVWESDHAESSLQLIAQGGTPPLIDEAQGRVYVGFADGTLSCMSLKDGKTIWEKSLKGDKHGFYNISFAPEIESGHLFVSSNQGGIYALSVKDGKTLWNVQGGSQVSLAVLGENLYVSGTEEGVRALRKSDGSQIWETKLAAGALTAPVVDQDLVIVGLSTGTINFLDRSDGHLIANRFAKKGISSDPVIDEDHVYFLSNGGKLYSLRLITNLKID